MLSEPSYPELAKARRFDPFTYTTCTVYIIPCPVMTAAAPLYGMEAKGSRKNPKSMPTRRILPPHTTTLQATSVTIYYREKVRPH